MHRRHLPPPTCWSPDALPVLWSAWRRGGALCARGCAVGVRVLATPAGDHANAIYALHCVGCGGVSPWFEADGDELRTIRDAPTQPSLRPAEPVAG